ncbi:MAG: hypothetical protein WC453_03910 [Patescibacteria group bacterium]
MKKTVVSPAGIPVKTFPAEKITEIKESLLFRAGACRSQGISDTEILMKVAGCGYVTVTTDYNHQAVGYKPNELAVLPDGDIAMFIGVTHNSSDPQAWFISRNTCQGIIHFPQARNSEEFYKEGFAKVAPAG